MIKKELKTLGQLQNPSKSDTRRYRIHLEDGGHIDVTGIEERNSMIRNLVNAGRLHYGEINTQEIIPYSGPRITETETEVDGEKKSFKKLIKEDFGVWDWSQFFNKFSVVLIIGILEPLVRFAFDGRIVLSTTPTIETVPVSTEIFFTIGFGLSILTTLWLIVKIWKFLPYITCWFKLLALRLFLFLFTFLSIGFFSGSMAEKICDFIGGHTFTKKEHKIMSSIL